MNILMCQPLQFCDDGVGAREAKLVALRCTAQNHHHLSLAKVTWLRDLGEGGVYLFLRIPHRSAQCGDDIFATHPIMLGRGN